MTPMTARVAGVMPTIPVARRPADYVARSLEVLLRLGLATRSRTTRRGGLRECPAIRSRRVAYVTGVREDKRIAAHVVHRDISRFRKLGRLIAVVPWRDTAIMRFKLQTKADL